MDAGQPLAAEAMLTDTRARSRLLRRWMMSAIETSAIRRLALRNFRSFHRAAVSLENLTILVGPNASGKSNLLEAIPLPPTSCSSRGCR